MADVARDQWRSRLQANAGLHRVANIDPCTGGAQLAQ